MCLNLKYLRSSRDGNITSKCTLWMPKAVATRRISLSASELVHYCHHMVNTFNYVWHFHYTNFPFVLLPPPLDETIISEDPTPAETSNPKNRKNVLQQQQQQSQMIILAALVLAAGIIITSIIVAGCVAICRIRRPKPPEPEEVRKRIR